MPGPFLDAHIHLWEYCLFESFPSLETTICLDECREALNAQPSGGWLVGVKFNEENIVEKALPDRHTLDYWFGDRPALIVRSCLHLLAMNTSAMKLLNMHSENGIFLENDVFVILNSLPPVIGLDSALIIKGGWNKLKNAGYTRVVDMAMDKAKRVLFNRLDYYTSDWDLLNEALGFKLFLDGSLGARTAALLQPYSDDPGNCGRLNYDDIELLSIIDKVHNAGKPVACHAIGDRAVEQFLKVVQKSRHPLDRIEHLQVATPGQIEELARLDIPVCIQPSFSGELPWARLRLGEDRSHTAYAWNLLRQKGIRLLAGTDAPVDGIDPFHAAHLAAIQDGSQHLDRQFSINLFARSNWSFYGWLPGSSTDII